MYGGYVICITAKRPETPRPGVEGEFLGQIVIVDGVYACTCHIILSLGPRVFIVLFSDGDRTTC